MLLLQRGGGYNAQQKAKTPSSLPSYTLTIFVLMSPGLWEGCGLAHSVQGSAGAFLLETVTGAPHQKRTNEGLHWTQLRGAFPVPHAHTTPFAPPRRDPGLCIRTQLCARPYHTEGSLGNAEKQRLYPLEFRTSDPMGLPLAEGHSNGENQDLRAHIALHTPYGSRCKQTKCERPFSKKLEKLGRAWVSSITCLW